MYLLLKCWVNLLAFSLPAELILFPKKSKAYLRNTSRVSNSLDPDQARQFVGPTLGPNCFQRLSADDTSNQCILILDMYLTALLGPAMF